jgi:hypothetical protein
MQKRMESEITLQEPKMAGSEVEDSDHVEDIKSSDMSPVSANNKLEYIGEF